MIVTVHELKRLARNAAELMALSSELQAGGIQLEMAAQRGGTAPGLFPDRLRGHLYAGGMRYPDGGGLTERSRVKREQVRQQPAG